MKYAFKTLIYFFVFMALAMYGSSAMAFNVPSRPDNGWYIVDTAQKVSRSDISILNNRIENFNQTTRNEIGVLIIQSLNGDSIEDAAHDVFHSWGIGKAGLDNGILIMIVANDHKMRIETGKGAEGDITDAKVMEITGGMKPFLRRNDYAGAITSAVDSITKTMEDRKDQKAIVNSTTPGDSETTSGSGMALFVVLGSFMGIGGLILLVMWIISINERRRFRRYYKNAAAPKTIEPSLPNDPYYPPPPPRPQNAQTVVAKTSTSVKKPHKKYRPGGASGSNGSSGWNSSGGGGDSGGSGFGGGDSGGGGGSDSW